MVSASGYAQTTRYDSPELVLRVTPQSGYLQQEIIQSVQLISAHPFEALDLQLGDVEGVTIVTLVKPSVRRYISYGVEGYAYETTRALFPSTSGTIRLPPVRIDGAIDRYGEELLFSRVGKEVLVQVKPIPESFSVDTWLVANRIDIEEDWSGPFDELRDGDSIRRTVSIEVSGVSGEQLADLTMPGSDGVTILPGTPIRTTRVTPGGLRGRMTQTFDIRIDRASPVHIAPVAIDWWHGVTAQARRSETPSHRIEPLIRYPGDLVRMRMLNAEAVHLQSRFGTTVIAAVLIVLPLIAALVYIRAGGGRGGADRRLTRAMAAQINGAAKIAAAHDWAGHVDVATSDAQPAVLTAVLDDTTPNARQTYGVLQQSAFSDSDASIPGLRDCKRLARAMIKSAARLTRQKRLAWLHRSTDHLLGRRCTLPELSDNK